MVDPTSDVGEDVSPADAPSCATCGDDIVNESTHRVITWVDDGDVQTAHFCDGTCREDWQDTA